MTTQPDQPPQDPAATLGKLAGSLGALTQQVCDLRRQAGTTKRRLDAAGVDQLAPAFAALSARFTELAGTVAGALDAASPKGPPAPRWDNLDPAGRERELASLTAWVDTILAGEYCAGGGYAVARCWASHPPALWELGALAAQWHRIYDRDRPDLAGALDFYDRWLPSAMRHLADMTAHCTPRCALEVPGHRRQPGLHCQHGHPDRA